MEGVLALQIPQKLFFRIGEVAGLLGLKPHVLRYWETEFPELRPRKTTTNQRRYARADIYRVALVRHLLHERRYTIAATRRVLGSMRLADDAVEGQFDLLAGLDEGAPAANHDEGPETPAVAPPTNGTGSQGGFLEERERLVRENTELRARCAGLMGEVQRLSDELEASREVARELLTMSRGAATELLSLLDESPREG